MAFNLFMIHDVTCAFQHLLRETGKLHVSKDLTAGTRDVAVAAVALAIQIAIDATDRDPTDLRALEAELISTLSDDKPAFEFMQKTGP